MTDDEPFTEDDLLDEIRKYLEEPDETGDREPGTITRPEIQREFELSRSSSGRVVKRLVDDRILEPDKVWRRTIWGDKMRRPGYRYTGGQDDATN